MIHYELGEKLGEGGMGEVYRGYDRVNRTPVAVKVLKAAVTEPEVLARFIREGESLRQLNHPNIVKLLDTREENGRHYLIMELVEGGSLADILAREEKLPVSRVLSIALDLADALTRAHRLNIIHRDLKPANILIASDGTPRLTDFGIARTRDSQMTESGVLLGTMAYLSPEQFTGGSASTVSDVWGFGMILFEMLTGQRPFDGEQMYALMNAIVNLPIPDLEMLCPDAPIGLIDLIYRMLAKNPDERIPSVRLIGAEIEALQQGRLTTSRRVSNNVPVIKSTFAPSTDGSTTKHNLPKQTTPFVGRDTEQQTLDKLLHDPQNRLITIIAPGGMGKTRLSLEVANAQLNHFPNGVYFVELAPLSRADSIPMAIAEAAQYPFKNDGRSTEQQLLDYLREKQQLLVLDNFEHIIEGRALVQSILQNAPDVKILVTSRERLNLSGETLFPLEGMSVPSGKSNEEILTYAAVKLFLQSARRIHLNYEPTRDEIPVIADLCRKVFGMPLGIVLAASWLEMLSVQEIADEINRSLDFLETTMQDIPERQRSLRALFEYSWTLLTEDDRQVFARLTLFHGGMTREAAQAVSGASLRTLQTLVNKSLVRRAADTGRYEIHEQLRQYAEEYLKKIGEWQATHERHAAYFADFIATREADIKGRRQIPALDEIETDFENLKAAWHWHIEHKNAGIDRMIETIYWFTTFRSRFQEGAALFREARAVWAHDSLLAGRLLVRYPDEPGIKTFKRGLSIAQQYNHSAEIAYCTRLLGHWYSHSEFHHEDGTSLLRESLKNYQAMGDKFYNAILLDDLGWSYNLMGNKEEQRKIVGECLALRREIGDTIGVCNALRNMGGAVGGFGSVTSEALVYWHEALEIAQTIGDKSSIAWNNFLIGALRVFAGEFDKGLPLAEKAYQVATEINEVVIRGMCLLLKSLYTGLVEQDYDTALQLSLDAYPPNSSGDLRTVVFTFAQAIALTGQKKYEEALTPLMTGLKMGLMFSHPPVGLWCIPIVAVYADAMGKRELAAMALGLVDDERIRLRVMDQWQIYRSLPQKLEDELGADLYYEAFEKGKHLEFKTGLQEVINLLSQ